MDRSPCLHASSRKQGAAVKINFKPKLFGKPCPVDDAKLGHSARLLPARHAENFRIDLRLTLALPLP